eukprot:gene5099-34899_t
MAQPEELDYLTYISELVLKTREPETDVKWPLRLQVHEDRAANQQALKGLFDVAALNAVAEEKADEDREDGKEDSASEDGSEDDTGPLIVGDDIVITKLEDGQRQEYHEGQIASAELLEKSLEDGCVIQVDQPQRYMDQVWRLVAGLEAKLGCLVGCSATIIPAGAELREPMPMENCEVFVIQLEGSSIWTTSLSLPNEVKLGKELLMPGDVLYLPRGTFVPHATASDARSTHILLSTFHHWTWADLSSNLIKAMTADEGGRALLPSKMANSLPAGFLSTCGLPVEHQSGGECYKSVGNTLAACFRAMADKLDSNPQDLLPAAVDKLADSFYRVRLPPHPDQLSDKGPEPTMDSSLIPRATGMFTLLPMDFPPDAEVPEGFIMLCTPLFNKRSKHLLPQEEEKSDAQDPFSLSDEDEEEEEEVKEKVKGKGSCAITGCGSCAPSDKPKKQKHVHGTQSGHHGHGKGKASGKEEAPESDEGSDDSDDGMDSEDEMASKALGPLIPASYSQVVSKVLTASKETGPVLVRSLIELAPHKDEEEVMRLALMLWEEGFVTCIPPAKKASGSKPSEERKKAVKRDPKGTKDAAGPSKKKKKT